MTNYYIPSIYIVPLISVDGQASPRLFIAPEIRHEKISYRPWPDAAVYTVCLGKKKKKKKKWTLRLSFNVIKYETYQLLAIDEVFPTITTIYIELRQKCLDFIWI